MIWKVSIHFNVVDVGHSNEAIFDIISFSGFRSTREILKICLAKIFVYTENAYKYLAIILQVLHAPRYAGL